MNLFHLLYSFLLLGSINPIHFEQHFLYTILTQIVVLHLQIEQQLITLSRGPSQLLRHFISTTAATLSPRIGDTEMPQLYLLHNILEIVQSFAILESCSKFPKLVSFLEENDQPVYCRPCFSKLKELFSLALGFQPISRLLLSLPPLVVADYIIQSLDFSLY